MNAADVEHLVGRTFIAKSGNIVKIERIGPGALRAHWILKPSEEDQTELEEWAKAQMSEPVRLTKSVGRENEEQNYQRWRDGK